MGFVRATSAAQVIPCRALLESYFEVSYHAMFGGFEPCGRLTKMCKIRAIFAAQLIRMYIRTLFSGAEGGATFCAVSQAYGTTGNRDTSQWSKFDAHHMVPAWASPASSGPWHGIKEPLSSTIYYGVLRSNNNRCDSGHISTTDVPRLDLYICTLHLHRMHTA